MEDRARLLRAASEAQARGRDIERQLLDRYPRAWDQMDAMREDPPTAPGSRAGAPRMHRRLVRCPTRPANSVTGRDASRRA
jgi:hypothetical protein